MASATNAVADTAADAAAFPTVASALPAVAIMGDAGKIPVVASAVSSVADLLADAMAILAVALAIPVAAVGGDAGNISVMALAVTDHPARDRTRDCVRATRYCGRTIEHAT